MLKSIAYSLLIVTSCALHGMETETINLSDILSMKLAQIKLLKAGQKINVTEKDNETLAQWIVMYPKNSVVAKARGTQYNFMAGPNNNNKHGKIEPFIYILKEDSHLNENYFIHTLGYIPHQHTAH